MVCEPLLSLELEQPQSTYDNQMLPAREMLGRVQGRSRVWGADDALTPSIPQSYKRGGACPDWWTRVSHSPAKADHLAVAHKPKVCRDIMEASKRAA